MNASPRLVSRFRHLSLAALTFGSFASMLGGVSCVQPQEAPPLDCPGSSYFCGERCVELQSNPDHCGGCYNYCGNGTVCTLGSCELECDIGLSECGESCANPLNNRDHCGGCFNTCGAGEVCADAKCVCPPGGVCGEVVAVEGSGGAPGTGGAAGTGGDGSLSTGGAASGGALGVGGSGASGGAPAGTGGMMIGGGGAPASGGMTSTGGTAAGVGGQTSSGGASAAGGAPGTTCTNVLPTGTDWPEGTCDGWANDTTECDSAWMIEQGACDESCGRCTGAPGG